MLSAPELVSLAASRGLRLAHLVPAARGPKRNGHDHDGVEWIPTSGAWRPQRAYEASADDLSWMVARFSLAGDSSAVWTIFYALTRHGLRIAQREQWHPQVRALDGTPKFYLDELARLVLEEQRHAALFAAAPAVLRAARLGVSDREWALHLARRHRSLASMYSRWLAQGLALARAAILEQ